MCTTIKLTTLPRQLLKYRIKAHEFNDKKNITKCAIFFAVLWSTDVLLLFRIMDIILLPVKKNPTPHSANIVNITEKVAYLSGVLYHNIPWNKVISIMIAESEYIMIDTTRQFMKPKFPSESVHI